MTLGLFFPTQPAFSGRGLRKWLKRAIETPAVEVIDVETGEVIDPPFSVETVKPYQRAAINVCSHESNSAMPSEFLALVTLSSGATLRANFRQFAAGLYRMELPA